MSQKADNNLRGTENKADAIVMLPGRVYIVINLTLTAGDWHKELWVISINEKLIFSDLHCLTITVLHDFALFHQLKYFQINSQLSCCTSPFKHSVSFMNESALKRI